MLDIKHYQKGQKYVSSGDGLKGDIRKHIEKGCKTVTKDIKKLGLDENMARDRIRWCPVMGKNGEKFG